MSRATYRQAPKLPREYLPRPDLIAAPEQWAGVDWTLTNAEIARSMGIGSSLVRHRRPAGLLPERTSRWEGVNWSRPDAEIAKGLGVTVNSVRFQRRKL